MVLFLLHELYIRGSVVHFQVCGKLTSYEEILKMVHNKTSHTGKCFCFSLGKKPFTTTISILCQYIPKELCELTFVLLNNAMASFFGKGLVSGYADAAKLITSREIGAFVFKILP